MHRGKVYFLTMAKQVQQHFMEWNAFFFPSKISKSEFKVTVISALWMQTQFLKPLNPGIVRRSPNIIVARNSFWAAPHFLANLALTTYSHHPLHSLQCQGELVQLEILYLKLIIFINPKWIMLNKIYKYLPSSQMIEAKIHWHPLVASSSEIHC